MLAHARIASVVVYARDLARAKTFYAETLGLRLVGETDGATRYAAGVCDIHVRSAEAEEVVLEDRRDETALMVFLVDDIDAATAALTARGARFEPTLRYEIGATAACYDPDGHNITLYEPSAEALTWPSAAKIREVASASVARFSLLADSTGGSERNGRQPLTESPLVYLFLFVSSADAALRFYHQQLGLRILEEDADSGVVKYDAGSLILATHMVGGDAWCAVDVDLTHVKGLAPVFELPDPARATRALSTAGIRHASHPSTAATVFDDPNGHRFWIRAEAVPTTSPARALSDDTKVSRPASVQ